MANFQGSKINPKSFSSSQLKFYIILIPLAIFMVLPVVYIINHAFKPMGELFAFPPKFFVRRPTLDNFQSLMFLSGSTGVPMLRYLLNSIIITVVTVVLNVIVTVSAAYALSKKKFRVKETIFKINQLALMFVPVAVTIPKYLVIVNIGMINTWFAHILPLIAMPIGLFLVKQFIDQLPVALVEAATMDGANDFFIVMKIIIPLTKPAISTVCILTFQTVWNAVESSNNYITNDTMRTLAFYLTSISTNNNVAASGMVAAASLIMFLPNLIIFIFMQSQVMSTMSHSGIK